MEVTLLELMCAVLLLLGSFFMLVAAVGVIRMPDLYMRMSAATKGATLGAGLMLLAVALFFREFSVTTRALAAVAFIFLTNPVAAHMIGRAGYINRVPLWKKTSRDELRGRFNFKEKTLGSYFPKDSAKKRSKPCAPKQEE